ARAFAGQRGRDGETDPRRAAADKSELVFQTQIHRFIPLQRTAKALLLHRLPVACCSAGEGPPKKAASLSLPPSAPKACAPLASNSTTSLWPAQSLSLPAKAPRVDAGIRLRHAPRCRGPRRPCKGHSDRLGCGR